MHWLLATALPAEEINKLRMSKEQVIIPQIDARFGLTNTRVSGRTL